MAFRVLEPHLFPTDLWYVVLDYLNDDDKGKMMQQVVVQKYLNKFHPPAKLFYRSLINSFKTKSPYTQHVTHLWNASSTGTVLKQRLYGMLSGYRVFVTPNWFAVAHNNQCSIISKLKIEGIRISFTPHVAEFDCAKSFCLRNEIGDGALVDTQNTSILWINRDGSYNSNPKFFSGFPTGLDPRLYVPRWTERCNLLIDTTLCPIFDHS